MRARSVVMVLSLLPALLVAQQRGQDTRPGIAVLPFNNGGSYGQGKEDFDALERGIAGMMISELAQNAAARVVERQEIQRLVDEQNLGAQGRVEGNTAAKIGKLVGARYMVMGTFVDFYGDFRVDVRLINTETGEVVKTESERMQRDHLYDIIRNERSPTTRALCSIRTAGRRTRRWRCSPTPWRSSPNTRRRRMVSKRCSDPRCPE